MPKALITGITGFIGSYIAEILVDNSFEVIGLKRTTSDIWRCEEYKHKICWIDLNSEEDWQKKVVTLSPEYIIHCAWIGVEASERDQWRLQSKNIDFLTDLIEISAKVKPKKFVFLGSQAEYGFISGQVTEEYPVFANNAYGAVKLACLELLKTFCQNNNIDWLWLRVFSLFGEKENENWLIPSVIKKMQHAAEMDFTLGEQKYAYMYVRDFASIVLKILKTNIKSGVYNISGTEAMTLKDVLNNIRRKVNPDFKLNFGVIPYRKSQSMHIEGSIAKLINQIGNVTFTNFNVALQATIAFYLEDKKNESI